ncbi:MAG: MBL fold metallo-hydrolase, partial [Immundisolibacteraceae bacterium]|nr:MBL fold metallo-hydrolase [Immundisolibacteraceae bacterium]
IKLGEYSIRVIHTPGHVANHLCFLLNEPSWLFAGDMVMDGSTVVIAPPDGDMADYVTSLERLKLEPIEFIAPAHGRLIPEPAKFFQSMVDHRNRREQKVIAGLLQLGPVTIDKLVMKVYDDVPEVLHGAALMSLQAHLFKCQQEGIALYSGKGETWSLIA